MTELVRRLNLASLRSESAELSVRAHIDDLIRRAGPAIWMSPLGTAQFNGRAGGSSTIELPIIERAVLGASLGASLVGQRVLVDIPMLSFLSTGLDMLLTAPLVYRTDDASIIGDHGPIAVLTTVSHFSPLSPQHDWYSYDACFALNVDRVLLARSSAEVVAMVDAWWDSNEIWVIIVVTGHPNGTWQARVPQRPGDLLLFDAMAPIEQKPTSSGSRHRAWDLLNPLEGVELDDWQRILVADASPDSSLFRRVLADSRCAEAGTPVLLAA